MASLNGRRKTSLFYCDTENTYTYDGNPVTYEFLDELSNTTDVKTGVSAIDYEKVGVGRVLFGICGNDDDVVQFFDHAQFTTFISTLTDKNIIYFFNLSYDINYFGKVLKDGGFTNVANLINMGSIISLEFVKQVKVLNKKGKLVDDKVTISLRDIRKFTGGSLKTAGEMFECVRTKQDFPITCDDDLDLPIVRQYLENDVLMLKEVYTKALTLVNTLQDELGVTKNAVLPLTAGSLAINMIIEKGYPVYGIDKYKNKKAGFQRVFGHISPDEDKLFRRFYYGALGACNMPTYKQTGKDTYKVGYVKDPIYMDVKSMYPFHMVDKEFPTYIGSKKSKGFKPVNNLYTFGFYVVKLHDVSIKNGRYPSVISGKNYKDDVSLLLSETATYIYLIDHYGTRSDYKNFINDYVGEYTIEETTLCKGSKFSKGWIDYILTIYDKKNNSKSNKGLYSLLKLLLNGVYGKIGQNMAHQKTELVWNVSMDKYKIEMLDDLDIEVNSQLSVAIASCITMYARNYLLDIVDKFGAKNIMLTATDCVITLNNEHTRSVRDMFLKYQPLAYTTLGMLDEDEIDKLALYGTKAYQYVKKNGKLINKQAGLSETTKNSLPWLYPNTTAVVNQRKSKSIVGGRYLALTTFKFQETPSIILNRTYQKEVMYD